MISRARSAVLSQRRRPNKRREDRNVVSPFIPPGSCALSPLLVTLLISSFFRPFLLSPRARRITSPRYHSTIPATDPVSSRRFFTYQLFFFLLLFYYTSVRAVVYEHCQDLRSNTSAFRAFRHGRDSRILRYWSRTGRPTTL